MDKPAWLCEWLPEALVEDATASCTSYQAYADLEAWWDDNAEGKLPAQQTVTKALMDAYAIDPSDVRQANIRVERRRRKVRVFEGFRLTCLGLDAPAVEPVANVTEPVESGSRCRK